MTPRLRPAPECSHRKQGSRARRNVAGRIAVRLIAWAAFSALVPGMEQALAAGSPASSRDANWREDLQFLVRCFKDIHPRPFWRTSETEFDSLVAHVDRRIPELDDPQIAVEFMRISALLCDGHGGVDGSPLLDCGRLYPVRVYPFQDGVYVISAAPEYAEHVGSRVESIGDLPVQVALERVMEILGGENAYTRLNWAPLLLVQPRTLRVLGITETEERIRFGVTAPDGTTKSFEVRPVHGPEDRVWYVAGEGLPVPGCRIARQSTPGVEPLCWRDRDQNYWFEYVPEQRLLWMQFNSVLDAEDESLEQFCVRLFDFADRHDVDKFVIDLRWNDGGNLELLHPLLHGIIRREATLGRSGHFFAAIGRATFSAAHVCAVQLEEHTNVIFVGEPSGATPNHFGDTVMTQLPHSGLPIYISKWAWQPALPWDVREWIAPQIPAPFTFADYRSNRDPALDAVLRCERAEPSVMRLLYEAMEKGGEAACGEAYREWRAGHPDSYGWTAESELTSLAYSYLQGREPDKGIAVLQLALETYPTSAVAIEMLGEAYQAKGERDRAADCYRRALALDPRSHAAAEMLRRVERDQPPSSWR